MYHPTTRLLTILNLLQSHEEITGQELSRRLEVDPRTIRRYIATLQDMGIPIEAERGRAGAYFLRPSYKLPPLMFNAEEAFAITLSLRLAGQTALFGSGIILDGASAKIERVLPENIRRQVNVVLDSLSMETNLVPTVETSANIIQSLANACHQHQRISLEHKAYKGEITVRDFDSYGVAYRVGRWYVVGYCHLREAIRTFRLDRILSVHMLDITFEPQAIDILEYVERALASTPGLFHIEVIFQSELTELRHYIPTALGTLETIDSNQTKLSSFVQSLPWIAGFLAGIPHTFRVLQPPALKHELENIVLRLQRSLTIPAS